MTKKNLFTYGLLFIALPYFAAAETVGSFFEKAVPQHQIAVGEIEKALIDHQVHTRYNFLSVLVMHPFPALVDLSDSAEVMFTDLK